MRLQSGEWNTLIPYLTRGLRCPACCAARLIPRGGDVTCDGCGQSYTDTRMVLDLRAGRTEAPPRLYPLGLVRFWEQTVWPWALRQLMGGEPDLLEAFVDRTLQVASGPVVCVDPPTVGILNHLARRVGVARVLAVGSGGVSLESVLRDPRDAGCGLLRVAHEHLPFETGSIGGCVAVRGVGRFEDPVESLAEAGRAMASGSTLVSWGLSPQGSSLQQWWARVVGRWLGVTVTPTEEMLAWVRGAGLEPQMVMRTRHVVIFAARRR
ncbi:MAG: hypothetical protein ACON5B_00900 [Myxococcota bacterium]